MTKREEQKTEYKSSWHDEYFEWICGYANAKGGRLHIGVNDDGYVVGLTDAYYLLDVLPNKITDTMGIVVEIDHNYVYERGENIKYRSITEDVAQKPENLYVRGILTKEAMDDIDAAPGETQNVTFEVQNLFKAAPGFVKQLRQSKDYRAKIRADIEKWTKEKLVNIDSDGSLEYITISVRPYPYGISYHNHYYTRSGGTTKELKGIALSAFLMERAGKHWDGMPMPGIRIQDLDSAAIEAYRKKATENGRHTLEDVSISDEQIISDLKLIDESQEGKGNLMRAAILMFHSDPEKYVTGATVKVAYYAPEGAYGANKSDDIIYHDEIHGPLMLQADRVVDLVYTKYLKALISYDGLQRIETFMTPKEAFREVILNAINHKLYESGNPIQISVYEDKIIVFNQGYWPEDIRLEDIYSRKHSSYPHNPNLTRSFFNAGEIEAYGSGFSKIKIECDKANAPYPELEITPNGITVNIKASEHYLNLLHHGRYWRTYPVRKNEYLTDEKGNRIIIGETAVIVGTETREIDENTTASLDRMMEILSEELSETEKIIYAPIAEFLKTHETIKNSDVMSITHKGPTSANRYLSRLVKLKVLTSEGNKKGRIYRRVSTMD